MRPRLGFAVGVCQLFHDVRNIASLGYWLRLSVKDKTLSLVIEDNGQGFASDNAKLGTQNLEHSRLGNGLANVRDRMTQLGGQIAVRSGPGQGTKIELLLPLE